MKKNVAHSLNNRLTYLISRTTSSICGCMQNTFLWKHTDKTTAHSPNKQLYTSSRSFAMINHSLMGTIKFAMLTFANSRISAVVWSWTCHHAALPEYSTSSQFYFSLSVHVPIQLYDLYAYIQLPSYLAAFFILLLYCYYFCVLLLS